MPLRQRVQGRADVQFKRARQMIDHLRRVIDRRQIHQPHAIPIVLQQQFGHAQRHGGLADAAGPDQGHAAAHRQLPHQTADNRIATGDRREPCRQVVLGISATVSIGERRDLRRLLHRRDKAVAALGNVDDVAAARPARRPRPDAGRQCAPAG